DREELQNGTDPTVADDGADITSGVNLDNNYGSSAESHLVYNTDNLNYNPLYRSADNQEMPWAVSITLKTDIVTTSVPTIVWSYASSTIDRNKAHATLYIQNQKLKFAYGTHYNHLRFTSVDTIDLSSWSSVVTIYKGGKTGGGSNQLNQFYNEFEFYLVALDGTVQEIPMNGAHRNYGYSNQMQSGKFRIAATGQYNGINNWYKPASSGDTVQSYNYLSGSIAYTIMTTLTPLKADNITDEEIQAMAFDPTTWLADYKEDTNYRVSGSTNITSNFTSSDASDNSWKSTQVWIFDENNIETN
ncbi:hypothetical protein, partial [Paraphotobacterium marinum]